MANLSQWSLQDLCAIRTAYLMWTRRYVTKKCPKETFFNECVGAVLSDVQRLRLPDKLKLVINRQVEPTGKHLLSLLSLWIFAQPENSQQCLTGDILFECLILNPCGLINQRKTAEKILRSRVVDNVFAFRLAAINFLEKEVLKLWVLVKDFILKKLILDCAKTRPLKFREQLFSFSQRFEMRDYAYSAELTPFPKDYTTKEREEVLFWIGYCLAKENGIRFGDITHFLREGYDWYEFALRFAIFSGNVAAFEYFQNSGDTRNVLSPYQIITDIFSSHVVGMDHSCSDRQLPCFIFHYELLNNEERLQLFKTFPSGMLYHFFQWPLSLTFLNNHKILWDFVKVNALQDMSQLFRRNVLRLPATDASSYLPSFSKFIGIYSSEHLSRIWVALWNISSESLRSKFLNSLVFIEIRFNPGESEFRANFESSGLKEKLLELLISNGEALLELYEKEYLQESLRNLIRKYRPEHYEDLDRKCISSLANNTRMGQRIKEEEKMNTYEKRSTGPIREEFVSYLNAYHFSLNAN